MRPIFFYEFKDALNFLKKIAAGKVVPHCDSSVDGYLWSPENSIFSPEQLEIISEQNGDKYIFVDQETNLSWYLKDATGYSFLPNPWRYGGHTDWRRPTLKELRTLSSTTRNKSGTYTKDSLNGLIQGAYISISQNGADTMWWDFDNNCQTHEEYTDGRIIWGNEGDFAGFEPSKIHNHAKIILVRGGSVCQKGWPIKVLEWLRAEDIVRFKFQPTVDYLIEEVTHLSIKSNPPPEIDNLRGLERVEVLETGGMPNISWSLPKLRELVIRRLNDQTIPERIFQLSSLELLLINNDCIKEIPESIGNLENLRTLILLGKGVITVPESIGNLGKLVRLEFRRKVNCIPSGIGNLASLKDLYVSGEFSTIPESLGLLKNLRRLECAAPLESLPASTSELASLKELFLFGAPMHKNIQNVFKISSLERLGLGYCPIEKLPDDFSSMKNLIELSLSNTLIEMLPESMLEMEKLQVLDVRNSKINSLPDWLIKMKSLRKIIVSDSLDNVPTHLKDSSIYIAQM